MKKLILIGILISVVLISGCVKGPVGCPEDTKLCPDGSTVVRIPPECEFEECPKIKEEPVVTFQGCPTGFHEYMQSKIIETEETEYAKCYNGDMCFTIKTTEEDFVDDYELWQILLSNIENREVRKDFSNIKFKCILEGSEYTCDYISAPALDYTVMLKKGDQKIILDQPIILDSEKNIIDMSCSELS